MRDAGMMQGRKKKGCEGGYGIGKVKREKGRKMRCWNDIRKKRKGEGGWGMWRVKRGRWKDERRWNDGRKEKKGGEAGWGAGKVKREEGGKMRDAGVM